MSYNIDHVETLVLDAWMHAKDILDMHDNHSNWLPEGNFIEQHLKEAKKVLALSTTCDKCNTKNDLDASFCKKCATSVASQRSELMRIRLKNFWFYGEGSGHAFYDHMVNDIAPKVMGTVEAVLIWEGGDHISGLIIKDGKACECKIRTELIKPDNW